MQLSFRVVKFFAVNNNQAIFVKLGTQHTLKSHETGLCIDREAKAAGLGTVSNTTT